MGWGGDLGPPTAPLTQSPCPSILTMTQVPRTLKFPAHRPEPASRVCLPPGCSALLMRGGQRVAECGRCERSSDVQARRPAGRRPVQVRAGARQEKEWGYHKLGTAESLRILNLNLALQTVTKVYLLRQDNRVDSIYQLIGLIYNYIKSRLKVGGPPFVFLL